MFIVIVYRLATTAGESMDGSIDRSIDEAIDAIEAIEEGLEYRFVSERSGE